MNNPRVWAIERAVQLGVSKDHSFEVGAFHSFVDIQAIVIPNVPQALVTLLLDFDKLLKSKALGLAPIMKSPKFGSVLLDGLVDEVLAFVIGLEGQPSATTIPLILKFINMVIRLMAQEGLLDEHPDFGVVFGIQRSIVSSIGGEELIIW